MMNKMKIRSKKADKLLKLRVKSINKKKSRKLRNRFNILTDKTTTQFNHLINFMITKLLLLVRVEMILEQF